jgi:hypothetical protein
MSFSEISLRLSSATSETQTQCMPSLLLVHFNISVSTA